MRLSCFTQGLALFTCVASAGLIKRQSVSTIATLPSGAWIEVVVARSNGQLLLNRLDTPELWTLDPTTQKSSKVVGVTNALGLTGITEISPDVFVVIAGNFTTKTISYTKGTWGVWKVDLTGAAAKATHIAQVPEADFLIGTTPFNNDTVFIADGGKGALYQLTVSTGAYSVVLQDPTMLASSSAPIAEGLHGLKYTGGYLYYTNTFGNGFYKLKIDPATGKPTGAPIGIAPTLSEPEDFIIAPDGSAYIATLAEGIVKVTPDGKWSTAVNFTAPSSVAFGKSDKDKSTLYISSSSGTVSSLIIS
jgi:hypothetical protein